MSQKQNLDQLWLYWEVLGPVQVAPWLHSGGFGVSLIMVQLGVDDHLLCDFPLVEQPSGWRPPDDCPLTLLVPEAAGRAATEAEMSL